MSDIHIIAKQNRMIRYARRFLLLPYRYGGDDPMAGFDCSGFVLEVLQAYGLIPRGKDFTADGIYRLFLAKNCKSPKTGYAGCLVFWPSIAKISHVALMTETDHIIHAAGGGPLTKTRDDAEEQNSYIREDEVDYRGKDYIILDPWRPQEKEKDAN